MHILFYTCNLTSNVYISKKCHCIKKDVTIILHGKLVTSLCFHKTFSPLALMAVTIGEGQKAHDKYMSQYRSQLSLLQLAKLMLRSNKICRHNTARSYHRCNPLVQSIRIFGLLGHNTACSNRCCNEKPLLVVVLNSASSQYRLQ